MCYDELTDHVISNQNKDKIMKVIKIKSAPVMGEYTPTTVDKRKPEIQLVLKSCNPKIVESKIELKGTGIKKYTSQGLYEVSNTAWNKLTAKYSWMTDF
jgi:hypothetical protein